MLRAQLLAAQLLLASSASAAGVACDVASCSCAGRSLRGISGVAWNATDVDDGSAYTYSFSICDPIPQRQLPVGCQANQSIGLLDSNATAIKFNPNEPTDCIELGSSTNMTGELRGDELLVTYTFNFGCINTFTVAISDKVPDPHDPASQDLKVKEDGCAYSLCWSHVLGGAAAEGSSALALRAEASDPIWCEAGPTPPPSPPEPEPEPEPAPIPPPPPSPDKPPAAPCGITPTTCVCANQELSALQKHDYHTAEDAEGFVYQFAICGTLKADALPKGCANSKTHPSPAAVKYKADDDSVCEELGALFLLKRLIFPLKRLISY